MRKVNTAKVNELTGDYDDWLQARLKNKKAALAHLQVALDAYQKDQDKKALLLALKDIAKAQGGIGWLAKETSLNREHLYYLLSGKGNPRLDTLSQIFKAFGFHLKVV
ncbi:MAG: transcriptional regulator [Pseudomonadota bacterium]